MNIFKFLLLLGLISSLCFISIEGARRSGKPIIHNKDYSSRKAAREGAQHGGQGNDRSNFPF